MSKYEYAYEQPQETYKAYTDTSFVSGDSPVVLDVFGDISTPGRLTYKGHVICDGPGSILVALSADGTVYGDNIPLEDGEKLNLRTHIIKKVKITHNGADSAYRTMHS